MRHQINLLKTKNARSPGLGKGEVTALAPAFSESEISLQLPFNKQQSWCHLKSFCLNDFWCLCWLPNLKRITAWDSLKSWFSRFVFWIEWRGTSQKVKDGNFTSPHIECILPSLFAVLKIPVSFDYTHFYIFFISHQFINRIVFYKKNPETWIVKNKSKTVSSIKLWWNCFHWSSQEGLRDEMKNTMKELETPGVMILSPRPLRWMDMFVGGTPGFWHVRPVCWEDVGWWLSLKTWNWEMLFSRKCISGDKNL